MFTYQPLAGRTVLTSLRARLALTPKTGELDYQELIAKHYSKNQAGALFPFDLHNIACSVNRAPVPFWVQ